MNTVCGQGIRVAEDFDNRSCNKYDTDPTPSNQELEKLPLITAHGTRLHCCDY